MKHTRNSFPSYLIIGFILTTLSAAAWWYRSRGAQQHTAIAPSMLVVGTNAGYPPFIMTDESGDIVGFDADVATEIAHRLKRTIAFKDMAFEALLLSLAQGGLDMTIGGMSITRERKKTGLLIPYYGEKVDRVAIFSAKPLPEDISLEYLGASAATACTQAGTIFEELLEGYDGVYMKTLPDLVDIILEVKHGHSRYGVLDVDTMRLLLDYHPWLQIAEVPLKPHEHIEGYGIGIAQSNVVLRKEVQATLAEMTADGTMRMLRERWFGPVRGDS